MNIADICKAFSRGSVVINNNVVRVVYSNNEFLTQYFEGDDLQLIEILLSYKMGVSCNHNSVEIMFEYPEFDNILSNGGSFAILPSEPEHVPDYRDLISNNCVSLNIHRAVSNIDKYGVEHTICDIIDNLYDDDYSPTFSEMRMFDEIKKVCLRLVDNGIECELTAATPEVHNPGFLEIHFNDCVDNWFDDDLMMELRRLLNFSTSFEIEPTPRENRISIIFYV